ncbi:MAG: GNAT family N-acetyltransferase [Acetobacteraceae bacterium]|nr:GNAT family N-acetyltransferase [Acetobacteraceae bacterium]MDW8398696.1 GNAT family N-acetyltransferase [Acetobacteraceae bacterium]
MNARALSFRRATEADLPAIVALLADDPLGAAREDPRLPLAPGYAEAFAAIAADPNQMLVVAEEAGEVVGTLQLTFIPGLSYRGAWRGQIEAVRIAAPRRGRGLGERMIRWALEQCRARGCRLVQLTTSMARSDAHRFYERLGFRRSHYGYKLDLAGG